MKALGYVAASLLALSPTSLSNAQMFYNKIWWPGTELNRRRQPFQGCALPPELPGHFGCARRLSTNLSMSLDDLIPVCCLGADMPEPDNHRAGNLRTFKL